MKLQGEIDDFHANSRIIPFRSRLFVRFFFMRMLNMMMHTGKREREIPSVI